MSPFSSAILRRSFIARDLQPSRQALRPGDICPYYAHGQCRWEQCKYLHVDPGQGARPQLEQRRQLQQHHQLQQQQQPQPQQPPFQQVRLIGGESVWRRSSWVYAPVHIPVQPRLPPNGPPGLPGPNARNIYTHRFINDNLCVTSSRPPSPIHRERNVPVIRLPRGNPSAPTYALSHERPPLQNVQAYGYSHAQAYNDAYPMQGIHVSPLTLRCFNGPLTTTGVCRTNVCRHRPFCRRGSGTSLLDMRSRRLILVN